MPDSTKIRFFFYFVALFAGLGGQMPLAITANSQPHTDTLRALIVFTQFQDDLNAGDPAVFHRAWPLFENRSMLPKFARHILAPTPSPPFPDSSLTSYFYEQSNGQFVLFGEVYDSVLVSHHPEARYHRGQGGYGDLTVELLDRIDSNGFDFTRYDHNGDGLLDHVFVVVRGDSQRDARRFGWTGASCLDARCSGSIAGGGPRESPVYDGIEVDWNRSGSIIFHRTAGNIIPLVYHVRLMAHELGHDLWEPFFVHIPSLQSNDVPDTHNRGRGKDCIGYALMAGSGGAQDCQGSQTISAYERDLLGWIDCNLLVNTESDLRLGDLYTTSECYKLPLGDGHERRLYLSNHQRIGYFDRLRRAGRHSQFDMGLLRTTGMLVMLANSYQVDVAPADNTMQLAVQNKAYEGDMFGPDTGSQLTPWTRPNINGFTRYPTNYAPRWAAIDNIRYSGDEAHTMEFDFFADFREAPVLREDSWFGREMEDYVFENRITITDGSALTIERHVSVAGELVVKAGSRMIITEGAELEMMEGSTLRLDLGARVIVEGTLVLDGLVHRHGNAIIQVGERGTLKNTTVGN